MANELSIQHKVMEYIVSFLKTDTVFNGLVKGYYHQWPSEAMLDRINKGNLYPFITLFLVSSVPQYLTGLKSERIRIQIDIFDKDIPNQLSTAAQRTAWLMERVESILDDAPIYKMEFDDPQTQIIDIWRENTRELEDGETEIKQVGFDYVIEVFRPRGSIA